MTAYLYPEFLVLITGIALGLVAVDGLMTLAGRREVISVADGRPLPLLHLGQGGRPGRDRGVGGYRHGKEGEDGKVGCSWGCVK